MKEVYFVFLMDFFCVSPATSTLSSKSSNKGTDINKSVKKSPVGVMTAHNMRITTIASGRCFRTVLTSTMPNFMRKNSISGN